MFTNALHSIIIGVSGIAANHRHFGPPAMDWRTGRRCSEFALSTLWFHFVCKSYGLSRCLPPFKIIIQTYTCWQSSAEQRPRPQLTASPVSHLGPTALSLTDCTATMKTFSNMAAGDHVGPSNRRQPVRQTRSNPTRATAAAQTSSSSNLVPPEIGDTVDPGFFPAITHFTNSITALPKEMIRHYTMLKEVDAKIYGPEAELGQLLSQALKNPPAKGPMGTTSQGTCHSMKSGSSQTSNLDH